MVARIIKHTEETIHVLFHLFHDSEIETPVMLLNSVVMLCDVQYSSLFFWTINWHLFNSYQWDKFVNVIF